MAGGAEVIVAGGTESMSIIPMGGNKISPNPWLVDHYPDAYLTMGLTAERLAERFGITRAQADEFSLHSHQKAVAALKAEKFAEEIVPVPVSFTLGQEQTGAASSAPEGKGHPYRGMETQTPGSCAEMTRAKTMFPLPSKPQSRRSNRRTGRTIVPCVRRC